MHLILIFLKKKKNKEIHFCTPSAQIKIKIKDPTIFKLIPLSTKLKIKLDLFVLLNIINKYNYV